MIRKFDIDKLALSTVDIKVAPTRLDQVAIATPEKLDLKGKIGALGEGFIKPPKTVPEIDVNTTIASSKSVPAYHSTLFRDFRINAIPTYNFYVQGENVAPSFDTSG